MPAATHPAPGVDGGTRPRAGRRRAVFDAWTPSSSVIRTVEHGISYDEQVLVKHRG